MDRQTDRQTLRPAEQESSQGVQACTMATSVTTSLLFLHHRTLEPQMPKSDPALTMGGLGEV